MEGDSVDAAGDGDNFRLNVQSFTDQQVARSIKLSSSERVSQEAFLLVLLFYF